MGAAGYALAGMQLVGTGLGAYAQVQSAKANKSIADFNASLDEMAARDAEERGRIQADEAVAEGGRLASSQRVAVAAQGIEVGRGTAAAIEQDTARQTARAVQRIQADAAREAWGLRTQATSRRIQARMGQQGAALSATGTILGGASQAGYMAYQTSRNG